ncbi:RDD family protein [Massilia sp. SR12]
MQNPYQAPVADLSDASLLPSDEGVQPAGFWRRVGAHLLDTLFMLPVVGLTYWGSSLSRYFYAWWVVPGLLIGLFYSGYLVQRFGGTPGKLLMKLRVEMADGSAVSTKAAFLRAGVLQLIGLATSLGLALSALAMDDATYLSMGFMQRSEALTSSGPGWQFALTIAMQVWIWGSLVVLLVNKRRRAPHDFIAGTVLVSAAP